MTTILKIKIIWYREVITGLHPRTATVLYTINIAADHVLLGYYIYTSTTAYISRCDEVVTGYCYISLLLLLLLLLQPPQRSSCLDELLTNWQAVDALEQFTQLRRLTPELAAQHLHLHSHLESLESSHHPRGGQHCYSHRS
mgnify:CR=1 FL=1